MTNDAHEATDGTGEGSGGSHLLDPWKAEAVEAEDRQSPIPGGEPACPDCGEPMIRHVEKHTAPRDGGSPFRVRLVCSDEACGAWTVYDW